MRIGSESNYVLFNTLVIMKTGEVVRLDGCHHLQSFEVIEFSWTPPPLSTAVSNLFFSFSFLDAITTPSSYSCGSVSGWVGQWVIVSDFPSLSAVVAGVWTQVDPGVPRWTQVTQVGPVGPN